MKPSRKDVEWLLEDLSAEFGYSMANRETERFLAMAQQGPEYFADAVFLAEGFDPNDAEGSRHELRQFVRARFERWAQFQMDYVHRKLQFDLVVWLGDIDDARQPPDPNSPWFKSGSIKIDAGEGHPDHVRSSAVLPTAPPGTTITWMYLGELNRFASSRPAMPRCSGLVPKQTVPESRT